MIPEDPSEEEFKALLERMTGVASGAGVVLVASWEGKVTVLSRGQHSPLSALFFASQYVCPPPSTRKRRKPT